MSTRLELARALRDRRLAPSQYQRILANKRVGDLLEQRSRRMSPEEMRDASEIDASLADFWVRQRRRSQP